VGRLDALADQRREGLRRSVVTAHIVEQGAETLALGVVEIGAGAEALDLMGLGRYQRVHCRLEARAQGSQDRFVRVHPREGGVDRLEPEPVEHGKVVPDAHSDAHHLLEGLQNHGVREHRRLEAVAQGGALGPVLDILHALGARDLGLVLLEEVDEGDLALLLGEAERRVQVTSHEDGRQGRSAAHPQRQNQASKCQAASHAGPLPSMRGVSSATRKLLRASRGARRSLEGWRNDSAPVTKGLSSATLEHHPLGVPGTRTFRQ